MENLEEIDGGATGNCKTCWHWSRELSGASAQNPRAMCLHHKNTQMYRMALETCELWKDNGEGARQWSAAGEGSVAPTASASEAALAEREACAEMLNMEAERAKSQMHASMTVMEVDRAHRRAIVLIEAANMIRERK